MMLAVFHFHTVQVFYIHPTLSSHALYVLHIMIFLALWERAAALLGHNQCSTELIIASWLFGVKGGHTYTVISTYLAC